MMRATDEATVRDQAVRTRSVPKVAYIMSRFPKLTETFVLYEIVAMERLGLQVEIYPLLREQTTVMHPEAVPLVERAHFLPFLSREVVEAHLYFIRRRPRAYLGALGALLRGTWGSARYFTRALALFPKSVLFARRMLADGVTHVHAHFASHPAAAAFVIRRLTGIPYSFTAHGSDIHRDRHMLAEKVAEAAFVVPISSFNRQVILDACAGRFADKMQVIHCGVDTTVFRPRGRMHSTNGHTVKRPFTLLCVGTLHEVKGQTHLIEACRLLRSRGVDLSCHFVGDGPDEQALKRQATDAGLADCVHFHGRQKQAEVISRLQAADVVVAPSVPSQDNRREGIPVALMEAMACGAPVVASRLSGIPELVIDGQNGLLTPPGDAQALADTLEMLALNPAQRRRLGEAGRETVERAFNLNANAAVLAEQFTVEVPV